MVIALTVSLGNWQMRRAAEKVALQRLHDQAAQRAPVDLAAAGAAVQAGARVTLTGRFLSDKFVLIDNRTYHGVAGFHVLMPMQLSRGGRTVLVLRGWIAGDPADRLRLPTIPSPPGEISIQGYFEPDLPQPLLLGKEAEPGPADHLWESVSFAKFRRWSGLNVAQGVVRQTSAADDGLVRDWTPSGPTAATHYGYAFQWYAMALATVLLWLWYGRPGRRQAGGHRAANPPADDVSTADASRSSE